MKNKKQITIIGLNETVTYAVAKEIVINLYDANHSYTYISKATGVCYETVRRWCKTELDKLK